MALSGTENCTDPSEKMLKRVFAPRTVIGIAVATFIVIVGAIASGITVAAIWRLHTAEWAQVAAGFKNSASICADELEKLSLPMPSQSQPDK